MGSPPPHRSNAHEAEELQVHRSLNASVSETISVCAYPYVLAYIRDCSMLQVQKIIHYGVEKLVQGINHMRRDMSQYPIRTSAFATA